MVAARATPLAGVCGAQSLFMMGQELRTCMRIDVQCVRENAALLGYLAQGTVRVLTLYDDEIAHEIEREIAEGGDDGGDGGSSSVGGGAGDGAQAGSLLSRTQLRAGAQGSPGLPAAAALKAHSRRRTAARSIARLLGREDTGAPVLFLDQPLFGHHLSAGDAGEDALTREALGQRLIAMGATLAAELGVGFAPWTSCIAPPSDGADAAGASASAAADAAARVGRVGLLELDGLSPQVYSNLRGRLVRGTAKARGLTAEPAAEEPQGDERVVLHALASAADLDSST